MTQPRMMVMQARMIMMRARAMVGEINPTYVMDRVGWGRGGARAANGAQVDCHGTAQHHGPLPPNTPDQHIGALNNALRSSSR